ncbi:MAG TPA: hypothetical protein VHM67_01215 [Gemmatimonadaceae bacterium]|nr:hypothetical protein [Gemmatimonadaceae bacterium]
MTRRRALVWAGFAVGVAGSVGGALLFVTRYRAYAEAMRLNRGAFFAPMIWQLSAGLAVTIIALAFLFGVLMVALGRTMERVDRLETLLERSSGPTTP